MDVITYPCANSNADLVFVNTKAPVVWLRIYYGDKNLENNGPQMFWKWQLDSWTHLTVSLLRNHKKIKYIFEFRALRVAGY